MNIRLQHIAIGIGLVVLMTFLFFKTTVINSESHIRFDSNLRHLKELDATLDKNILESRFGLQTSYDVLTSDSEEIQKLQIDLKDIPEFVGDVEKVEFAKSLERYSELQRQKNALLERFKSRNALINKSLKDFPVTTSNLIKKLSEKDSKQEETKFLNYLLRDILIFYLLTDKELEDTLNKQISTLEDFENKQKDSEDKTAINISLTHAKTILQLKTEIDAMVKESVEIPTEQQIEELIIQYDSYYNESLKQANFYRLLLYIISIVLIGYIALIIFKLKKTTIALNTANENLEERVQERTEELLWSNAELQDSRDYLDRIINAVADPIFVMNRQHKMTLVNDAMCDFIGLPREETIGKTGHELSSQTEASVYWEKDELVFTSGNENINEEQFTDPAGDQHTIITRKRLHTDKNGEQFIVAVSRDITENKKAEITLRESVRIKEESLALLNTILSSAPIGFAFYNCDLVYERVNETLAAINGLTVEEHIGRRTTDILPDVGADMEFLMRRVLETGIPINDLEASVNSPTDPEHQHYYLLNFYPVRMNGGEMFGLGVLVQDINDRKRIEIELQHSRDFLDKIINSVGDPILVKNRQHQLVLINDAMIQFMGHTREELIGKSDYDLVPEDEADVFWEKDELVFTSGEENINEESLTDSRGNQRTVVTRKRLYVDKEGEEFIVAVINDITEQKLSFEALIASEARFQSAFDYAPIGIGLAAINGNWLQVNHALCEIVGYSKDELQSMTFQSITHPDDVAESLINKDKLLSGELKTCQFEKRYIHKFGHQVLVLTSLSLIRDAQNKPKNFIAQVQDITERKLLETQLQRAQKLESIGQLAAGIAHEINTPTQYVGDNTRFLQNSFTDLAEVLRKNEQLLAICLEKGFDHEIVSEMQEAIEFADTEYLIEEIPKSIEQALVGIGRIGKIVQSMKDFAHPGSIDKKATDLNRAIESTITVASNEWKYVAEMVTDFDQTLPNVQCLIGEFNQVILNTIVNAAHSIADVVGDGTQGKGTIKISTKHKGDFVEISVSDTGTGISEEVRHKIFDPFFTTKEVGKGSGQGLAICHSVITEKHKGKILVESELGKGTTFIINLPINADSLKELEQNSF